MIDVDINRAALIGGVTGSLMTILYGLTFAFCLFLPLQYCFLSQLDKDISILKSEKRPITLIISRYWEDTKASFGLGLYWFSPSSLSLTIQ